VSDLLDILQKRIARQGPITVADYMAEALGHPEHGYYMKGDPFGTKGDFTTAPEISQMFGELIGLWCAVTWQQMDAPKKFNLVELGPGRGTLMADILRAGGKLQGFINAIDLYLVETSPVLRSLQEQALADSPVMATWKSSFAEIPEGPLILVANELFDALPVRQFESTANGWIERLVDCDDDGNLIWSQGPESPFTESFIPDHLKSSPVGDFYEMNSAGLSLMATLGNSIASHGGAALIIDYGHSETACGDTLQAVKDHQFHDFLADPGDADLTAHVDFQALKEIAEQAGATAFGPVTQGDFLRRLGIEPRAQQLEGVATERQKEDIREALERLTGADEMGTLFKVLAVVHPDQPRPEGTI